MGEMGAASAGDVATRMEGNTRERIMNSDKARLRNLLMIYSLKYVQRLNICEISGIVKFETSLE